MTRIQRERFPSQEEYEKVRGYGLRLTASYIVRLCLLTSHDLI